jgi:hypothetical protein
MEHMKKSYKPKEDKMAKLKTYYTKLKQNETQKNNQSDSMLFARKGK